MDKRLLSLFLAVLYFSNGTFAQVPLLKIVQNPSFKKVDIYIGKDLFTSLLYADSLKKAVLYPVNAPGNIVVNRGWPIAPKSGDQIDHPHQIGVWFNYGDVNGADYWNNSTSIDTNKKAYGTIKLNKIVSATNGKGKAKLVTLSTWYNPGGKAVLNELATYTFSVAGKERIIDRKTELTAIEDVLFKDSKEGLYGIRLARELEHPAAQAVKVYSPDGVRPVIANDMLSGKYESSTGVTGENVFGTRSGWLKLTGKVANRPVAIALIDHPHNIGYPGYWMARGYGLFAINPLGAEAYTNGKEKLNYSLAKGKSVSFNYRLVIANSLQNARIEQLANSFKTQ